MRKLYWQLKKYANKEGKNLNNIIDAALIISGALLISAGSIANEGFPMVIGGMLWAVEIAICVFKKIKK